MDAPLQNFPAYIMCLPADLIRLIRTTLPCPVDRRAMAGVCRQWRAVFAGHSPPIRALLPFLILPDAAGPTFACLLSGGGLHRLHVPEDARTARFFGSYGGGWLALSFNQAPGHALLNLHTGQRVRLPNATRRGQGLEEHSMVIHAAALSTPPLEKGCIGAAIVTHALHPNRPSITFWRKRDAIASGAFGTSWSLRVIDIVFYKGAFHCLTREERILVCSPVFHEDGRVEVGMELRVQPGRSCNQVRGRYLVESNGELLMVVRFCSSDRETTSFRVFRLIEAESLNNDKGNYFWDELTSLDDKMLFIGPCCSKSYRVADFTGFKAGVYFFDDQRFYNYVLPGEDESFATL